MKGVRCLVVIKNNLLTLCAVSYVVELSYTCQKLCELCVLCFLFGRIKLRSSKTIGTMW